MSYFSFLDIVLECIMSMEDNQPLCQANKLTAKLLSGCVQSDIFYF